MHLWGRACPPYLRLLKCQASASAAMSTTIDRRASNTSDRFCNSILRLLTDVISLYTNCVEPNGGFISLDLGSLLHLQFLDRDSLSLSNHKQNTILCYRVTERTLEISDDVWKSFSDGHRFLAGGKSSVHGVLCTAFGPNWCLIGLKSARLSTMLVGGVERLITMLVGCSVDGSSVNERLSVLTALLWLGCRMSSMHMSKHLEN